MTGNTEKIANIIQSETNSDIIKLETANKYPDDYNELLDVAQEQQQEEPWRIISVNTSDNTIKIMRNAVLSGKTFDTSSNGRYNGS